MKYKKGSFIVIPNIQFLDGKPPAYQAIFLWLCRYADDDGICFPSREKLAKHLDMDERTITRYITKMVEDGLIMKTKRRKTGEVKNNSNLYQILIVENQRDIIADQRDKSYIKQRDINVPVTIPSINYTHINIIPNESKDSSVPEVTLVEAKQEVDEPIPVQTQTPGQLPISRGNTRIRRVTSIYEDLFKYKYNVAPSLKMAVVGACIDKLSERYTELQIAAMMITFFNWKGLRGDSDFESNKLELAVYPFGWFYAGITQYEIYLRNVFGLKFDDENDVRTFVGKSMNAIK